MDTKRSAAILVLTMMMTSGCMGLVDDSIDNIEDTIRLIDGEYPQLELPERLRGTPFLSNYDECTSLLDDLKQSLYDEMLVQLDQNSYWHWAGPIWMFDGEPEMAMDGDVAADSSLSSQTSNSRDGEFSETNNQEAGVDEADFLKTDGYHIYMLNNNQLVIMGVPEFGDLIAESNMTLEGSPMQMMLDGDRLVIASRVNHWNLPENHPLLASMAHEESYTYVDNNGDEQTHTWVRYENLVKYSVIDISDRSAPEIERELYIEGNYHTARLVDGTVRSVTHLYTYVQGLRYYVDLPNNYWQIQDDNERMAVWNASILQTIAGNLEIIDGLTLEDFAPQTYEIANDGSVIEHPISSEDCSEFAASENSSVRGFTTIMTIQLLGEEVEMEVDHITSRWATVYSSQDMMILAEPAADWWWFWRNSGWDDATNIHAFDISDSTTTTYLGSGRVDGTVQDQFSISEYEGSIRIASTSDVWGRWWIVEDVDEDGEPVFTGPSNQVTILQDDESGELEQVGLVDGIAPNERIWSARFIGERGYLVTFENIDPLWVLDLSDPTDPIVLGELEVPGVSTYIHPLSEDMLLTIGIGPGPDGLGLDWSVTQISLFDVSDTSNPTLADVLPLSPGYEDQDCDDRLRCGWTWSWSEATYEHKAFTYWAPEELLAVPLSTYRYTSQRGDDGRMTYGYEFVSTLQLVDVDAENGTLGVHGTVNHSSFYNPDGELSSWGGWNANIRRSIFMGDFIYSFSALGAMVHQTDDLSVETQLNLPGYQAPSSPHVEEDDTADEGEASSGDE